VIKHNSMRVWTNNKNASEIIQKYEKKLFSTMHNIRRDLEKQDWFFEINSLRDKRNVENLNYFFEKPGFIPFLRSKCFFLFKKTFFLSLLYIYQKERTKKQRYRWSNIRKLLKIFFKELLFFSLNITKKKEFYTFINYSRQLVNFSEVSAYFCVSRDNNSFSNSVLTTKMLSNFFTLTNNIFLGWSGFTKNFYADQKTL